MQKLNHLFFAFIMLTSFAKVNAATNVPLNDPNIRYDGAFYSTVTETLVVFNRHKAEVVNHVESGIYGSWINQWVTTQTGVRVRFKTTSPTITMTFQKRAGSGSIGASPSNGFTVSANGTLIHTFSSLSFTINNPNTNDPTLFEVTLPNLWGVDLIGFSIDDTYTLEDPGTLDKPVYVAIGDSKTHGTGQYVSTAKTYPYQLAKLMDWDLYNMAVAGSTLGWAMALNVKGVEVDVITIELGYNDWEYATTSLSAMQTQYERLIDSVRLYQPNAKIFCITPIANSDLTGAAPYSQDSYRNMIQNIVTLRMQTDENLFAISGPSISNTSMLASGDVVHLSESGALTLAQNLVEPLTNPSSIVLTPLAINESSLAVKKKLDIGFVSREEILLISEEAGLSNVKIISIQGEVLEEYKEVLLISGMNRLPRNSSISAFGSAFIVLLTHGNELTSELFFIE
jgi:lysophospholipase L1-like esterase